MVFYQWWIHWLQITILWNLTSIGQHNMAFRIPEDLNKDVLQWFSVIFMIFDVKILPKNWHARQATTDCTIWKRYISWSLFHGLNKAYSDQMSRWVKCFTNLYILSLKGAIIFYREGGAVCLWLRVANFFWSPLGMRKKILVPPSACAEKFWSPLGLCNKNWSSPPRERTPCDRNNETIPMIMAVLYDDWIGSLQHDIVSYHITRYLM